MIACIGDPMVIETILAPLDANGASATASWLPPCRAPANEKVGYRGTPAAEIGQARPIGSKRRFARDRTLNRL
jgi:hypothetical protein